MKNKKLWAVYLALGGKDGEASCGNNPTGEEYWRKRVNIPGCDWWVFYTDESPALLSIQKEQTLNHGEILFTEGSSITMKRIELEAKEVSFLLQSLKVIEPHLSRTTYE
jgi:hypothetical protein